MGRRDSERIGADYERPRRGAEDTLGAVALAPFLDALEEPGALERAKVIVEALAGKAQPAGQPGGGIRFSERRQQGAASAPQDHGGLGPFDDLHAVWRSEHVCENMPDK